MSSRRDVRSFLWDVLDASDRILQFTKPLNEEDYLASDLVRAGVERKFTVIGEALNALSKNAPELANKIPELAKIVGFRNLLVHGYFEVDHRRVWSLIQTDLPGLRMVTEELLKAMR